jgi:glutathione S-transferase
MKVYGTTTSPFVRRVRIVAMELGVPVELLNTATDDGMARLREVSPIRKVPVADLDGRIIFDSREIIAVMFAARGRGPIAVVDEEANLVNAVDAALDAVIQLFYLKRDGVAIAGTPYETRQLDRAQAIFDWLRPRLSAETFGLAEISIVCALDWMDFRKTYPTEKANLEHVRAKWKARHSFAETMPHA